MPVILLLLSQLFDVLTSLWGLHLGLYESNPYLHHSVYELIAAKIVISWFVLCLWYAVLLDRPKAREVAAIAFYAVAGATFYVAGLNLLTIIHLSH